LLYSINEYRPLSILKQIESSVGTQNYDTDLTLPNKFYPFYSVFLDTDATGTSYYYLYVGSEDKFNNLLFSTQSVPSGVDADSYLMVSLEYYDSTTDDWETAQVLNIDLSSPVGVVEEQYLTWQITDTTKWGKFQIKDYNNYFVRIKMQKSSDGRPNLDVFKIMTYPFPGYIDIYCLKNYRDRATSDDKTLIAESIDNFKAAGVITTVADATVVQLHPTIVINTTNLTSSLIPSDLEESIRNDVIAYANTKNVGIDFSRNELYSYLYSRYSQYGNLFIFYKYDPSIAEDPVNDVYKEGFTDNILEAGSNEKIDLLLSDIYIIRNMNAIQNTMTGYQYADGGGLYNDFYQDPTATKSDIYSSY